MNYYENKENVEKYLGFAPTNDGSLLVDLLVAELPAGATVLELGMGPGKDFDALSAHFTMTGSDFSTEFLRLYRERNDTADLLRLDARTLDTDRTFDGIYSNKALIHLTRDELSDSLARQKEVLNDRGVILHSFWYGRGEEEYDGLRLLNQREDDLTVLVQESFEIIQIGRHAKMSEGDSIYVMARKSN